MASLNYDDTQLQALYAEMDVKQRLKSLKGAFRREANKVRKAAVNNLRKSIRSDRDLEKGVRAIVYKRAAGFRVTVGTKRANKNGKGEVGYHTNRRGLKKPILMWAESGTEARYTKLRFLKRTKSKIRLLDRGHPTGRMPRYAYMEKTRLATVNKVNEDLHNEIINNVQRVAKRYGCK